jgi:ankyrin repeat protein
MSQNNSLAITVTLVELIEKSSVQGEALVKVLIEKLDNYVENYLMDMDQHNNGRYYWNQNRAAIVDTFDFNAMSITGTAAKKGDLALITWTKEQGANLSQYNGLFSLMHTAARYNHPHIIKFLYESDVNINTLVRVIDLIGHKNDLPVKSFYTPLHIAMRCGNVEAAQALINLGVMHEEGSIQDSDVLCFAKNMLRVREKGVESLEWEHYFGNQEIQIPTPNALKEIITTLELGRAAYSTSLYAWMKQNKNLEERLNSETLLTQYAMEALEYLPTRKKICP